MRSAPSAVTNGVVSACALTALGLLLGRALQPRVAADTRFDMETEASEIANWAELTSGGTRIGPKDAPSILVTFSDFQCPYCARLAGMLARLRVAHGDRLQVLYRHFPLGEIHPHAYAAALASECAAEQGRFEPLHDLLYARQAEIGTTSWARFAADAGIADTVALNACMAANRHRDRILADARLGESLGVDGTPTVFLDGAKLNGGVTEARLARLLSERPARASRRVLK